MMEDTQGKSLERTDWLRNLLHYLIQFYIDAEATLEDVQHVVDGLSESDEYDDNVAALVRMPRWCGQDEAQEAVDHYFTPPVDAVADIRDAGLFLLDRLADHEARMTSDSDAREWHGHVTPAIERFRAALPLTLTGWGEA